MLFKFFFKLRACVATSARRPTTLHYMQDAAQTELDDVVEVGLDREPADEPSKVGIASLRAIDDEDLGGSDKARLMGTPAGSVGEGLVVNWHSYARPFEAGALSLVALLQLAALGGGDWLHGTNRDAEPVFAGLRAAMVGNQTGRLDEACQPSDPSDRVTCAVKAAGGVAATLLTLALVSSLLLLGRLALEVCRQLRLQVPIALQTRYPRETPP